MERHHAPWALLLLLLATGPGSSPRPAAEREEPVGVAWTPDPTPGAPARLAHEGHPHSTTGRAVPLALGDYRLADLQPGVSQETKQKLKSAFLSAFLSAQSAANLRKESLCQPALEVLETSSQESSLESKTDEDNDFMDI